MRRSFLVMLRSQRASQHNGLIAAQAGGSVDPTGVEPTKLEIALGANYEEGQILRQDAKPGEVEVTAVHDIEGSRLVHENVENTNVGNLSMSDVNKRWNAAAHVQQCMQLDSPLVSPEPSPRKQCQTQVDGRGIERINSLFELQCKFVLMVKFSCLCDQHLSEVGKDAPVASLVRICQRAARY